MTYLLERAKLDYVIDISISKEAYFCQIKDMEADVIRKFASQGTATSVAQSISLAFAIMNYIVHEGRSGMERKFFRQRILTCIKEKHDRGIFYMPISYDGKPLSKGIFLAWEVATDEALNPSWYKANQRQHKMME